MAKNIIKINRKGEDGYKIISVRIKKGTLNKIDDLSDKSNRSRKYDSRFYSKRITCRDSRPKSPRFCFIGLPRSRRRQRDNDYFKFPTIQTNKTIHRI